MGKEYSRLTLVIDLRGFKLPITARYRITQSLYPILFEYLEGRSLIDSKEKPDT